MLTKEDVIKIADLARIELEEQEIERLVGQLSAVLDYVAELEKVETVGLVEVAQVTGLVNVQREDKVVDHGNREEIFSQAPEMKDGYFKVRAIL